MKHRIPMAAPLLLVLGLGTAPGAWAAGAISQHTTESGSIELSNLDGPDSSVATPSANAPDTSSASSGSAVAKPKDGGNKTTGTAWSKRAKANKQGDEADENSESDSASEDSQADGGSTAANENSRRSNEPNLPEHARGGENSGMPGVNSGGISGGSFVGVYGGGSGNISATSAGSSGTSPTTSQPPSPTTPANTAGGSTSPTVADTSGNLRPIAAGLGGVGSLPTPATPEQTVLAQYRELMLQEATSPNFMNTNPAISRRYLAVDRVTYQGRIGQ